MYKDIKVNVNENDISPILTLCLNLIFKRHNKNLSDVAIQLEDSIKTLESSEKTIKNLELLELHFRDTIIEIGNLIPLIKQLDNKTLSADTEILEDLPDLEEDSLGVDGGGE